MAALIIILTFLAIAAVCVGKWFRSWRRKAEVNAAIMRTWANKISHDVDKALERKP